MKILMIGFALVASSVAAMGGATLGHWLGGGCMELTVTCHKHSVYAVH